MSEPYDVVKDMGHCPECGNKGHEERYKMALEAILALTMDGGFYVSAKNIARIALENVNGSNP